MFSGTCRLVPSRQTLKIRRHPGGTNFMSPSCLSPLHPQPVIVQLWFKQLKDSSGPVLIFRGRQRAWTTPGNDMLSDVVIVQVYASSCEKRKRPISTSKHLLLGGVVAVLPLMESCVSQDIFMGPTLREQWDTYNESFVRHPAFAKAFAMAAMAKEK